ncbi:MAG: hypothetical protein QOE72_899 [Chloroflexota bacterium]|jgi:PAS domain S-box-containing protein|nr:hypothetical protein [Chloroflexota bacterium]
MPAENAGRDRGRWWTPRPRHLRTLASAAALGLAYFLAARLGLRLGSVDPLVTAVWPPAGVAVAGLLMLGRRAWPGVTAAALLVDTTSGASIGVAAAIAVGNTVGPLASVTLLRATGMRTALLRVRDVLALVVLGGGGMLLSAAVGTATLVAAGALDVAGAVTVWPVWWVGDAMGVILITPLLLSLGGREDLAIVRSPRPLVESAALLVGAAAVCRVLLVGQLPLVFLVFPLAMWAALRLPLCTVGALNVLVAGIATWATVRGLGPFSHLSTSVNLVDLQAFTLTVAVTSLTLAAVVRDRRLAHRHLEMATAGLEAAVERRTGELSASNRSLAQEMAERRQVEASLRESEERYRSIFERAVEGVVRVDLDGRCLDANPALAAMLDYDGPAELQAEGRNAREHVADPVRHRELWRKLVRDGEVRDEELDLLSRTGRLIRTAVHMRTVQDAAGVVTAVEGIVVDITERQRAREALVDALERQRRATLELEALSRARDAFFATISHEFRTPIGLTLGPLEQVLAGADGELPDGAARRLQMAQRNQHRLLRLVDQILTLASLEHGGMALTPSPDVDVNRVVEELVAQFQPLAETRGVELRTDLDPAVAGADVWLDLDKLEMLLGNLVGNALKFTEEGSVEVSTRVERRSLVLRVSDTGTGITEEEATHIFDRFRQAGNRSHASLGTGLGLAISREIVLLHGGEITVSGDGRGTCFRATLPLGTGHLPPDVSRQAAEPRDRSRAPRPGAEVVEDEGALERINQAAEAAFDSGRPVVLYVDDVHDFGMHVRDLLVEECNVFLAGDGEKGLEHARRYRPDLLVVDERMPRMSGTELLREVRADPDLRSTPVIFVSALGGPETRVATLGAGADDYLVKPFHAAELRARVRNLLRARAQERELAEANRRLATRVDEQTADLVRTGELSHFLPRPLGDRFLSGELGVQQPLARRRVTVVVASVAGFSELAERLEPEDFSELVNDYLAEITAEAVRHGGMLDHLAGGGVMVLFGAPDAATAEDQAWSAAQAALAMRAALATVAAACRRRGVAVELLLRAGIDAGHATVGIFGSDLLRSYTAMGSVVSVATHLRGRAAPGQILCSGSTRAALGGRMGTRPCDPLARNGTRPVEVFELTGEPGPGAHGGAGAEPGASAGGWSPAGAAPPPSRVFRREGAYWTIAFEGSLFRLPDSKGLHHLARLLAHPGADLHVLQLVDLDRNGGVPARAAGADLKGLTVTGGDGVSEILDTQARHAYARRLEELRAEVEEAASFNDPERATRARIEIDALTEQLASALGLGGRSRRVYDDAERARVNVTKRIRAAIAAVAEHDPRLERHLRGAIRTGVFCSYAPAPEATASWSL